MRIYFYLEKYFYFMKNFRSLLMKFALTGYRGTYMI